MQNVQRCGPADDARLPARDRVALPRQAVVDGEDVSSSSTSTGALLQMKTGSPAKGRAPRAQRRGVGSQGQAIGRTVVLGEVQAALDRRELRGLVVAAQVERMATTHAHSKAIKILKRRQRASQVGLHPSETRGGSGGDVF